MKNILFLLLFVSALLLAFYFFYENNQTLIKLEEAKKHLSETENRLQQRARLSDSLQLKADSSAESPQGFPVSQDAIQKLRAAGFTDPEKQLLFSLQDQSGLLPVKGTAGGNMAYRNLTILTTQFALGYFEDGHNGGYAVLSYKVHSPTDIHWKLIGFHNL